MYSVTGIIEGDDGILVHRNLNILRESQCEAKKRCFVGELEIRYSNTIRIGFDVGNIRRRIKNMMGLSGAEISLKAKVGSGLLISVG